MMIPSRHHQQTPKRIHIMPSEVREVIANEYIVPPRNSQKVICAAIYQCVAVRRWSLVPPGGVIQLVR